MLYIGTRNTSGDGTAIATAGATERVRVRRIQLQLTESTGPVTVLLKLASMTIYQVLLANQGDGVVFDLAGVTGALGADLYVNLSDAKAVAYVIDAAISTL